VRPEGVRYPGDDSNVNILTTAFGVLAVLVAVWCGVCALAALASALMLSGGWRIWLKRLGVGLVVVIVLFFLSGGPGGVLGAKSPLAGRAVKSKVKPRVQVVPRVTATALCQEYKTNQVAADDKYSGKTVEVVGTVGKIGEGLLGGPYVNLDAGEGAQVTCSFPDRNRSQVASLSPRQSVTIRGTCEGLKPGILVRSVSLHDCSVVR